MQCFHVDFVEIIHNLGSCKRCVILSGGNITHCEGYYLSPRPKYYAEFVRPYVITRESTDHT
jgi:hypothetical protein